MSNQPGQVRKCRSCDLVETDYTQTKCQACGDMLLPVQQGKGRKSATKKAQRKSATKKVQKKSATKKKTQKK